MSNDLMVNDLVNEFGSFGSENVTSKDVSLPFLRVLQTLSKEVKKGSGKQIPGAEEGDIYNSVYNSLVKGEEGLYMVKAHFTTSYVEWIPREKGDGGFAGFYSAQEGEQLLRSNNLPISSISTLPNGNELALTYNYFVIVIDPSTNDVFPAIIPMSSTQLKVGKNFNSSLIKAKKQFNVPADAALLINMKTTSVSNSKGSWAVWQPTVVGSIFNPDKLNASEEVKSFFTPDTIKDIYKTAHQLYESVQSGNVKYDNAESDELESEDTVY